MFKRPLLIKLFAIYLMCEPIFRTVLMAIEKDFTVFKIINHSLTLAPLDIFNYWFLFPLSGFLLLSYKFYSYVIFMALQLYSLVFHLNYEEYTWPYLSKYPSTAPLLLLFINILITIYLIFPRTREPFMNKKLRWWETPARILVNIAGKITNHKSSKTINIRDISHSGLSVLTSEQLEINSHVEISFNLDGHDFNVLCNVIRQVSTINNQYFYGVTFVDLNYFQRVKLQIILFNLSRKLVKN